MDNNLRKFRIFKGYTQSQLANVLGKSLATYQILEAKQVSKKNKT